MQEMKVDMVVSLILLIALLAPLPVAYARLRYRRWKVGRLRPGGAG